MSLCTVAFYSGLCPRFTLANNITTKRQCLLVMWERHYFWSAHSSNFLVAIGLIFFKTVLISLQGNF